MRKDTFKILFFILICFGLTIVILLKKGHIYFRKASNEKVWDNEIV